MLLLPADMLGEIVTKGKVEPPINVKATPFSQVPVQLCSYGYDGSPTSAGTCL